MKTLYGFLSRDYSANVYGGPGTRTVGVWRLPHAINRDELRRLFSAIGLVGKLFMVYDRRSGDAVFTNYAFITFSCRSDARQAVMTLHGCYVGGSRIAVRYSTTLPH